LVAVRGCSEGRRSFQSVQECTLLIFLRSVCDRHCVVSVTAVVGSFGCEEVGERTSFR